MLTLAEALAATHGELVGPERAIEFSAVGSDSRAVAPGSLFVCLRGERFDGHAFAAAAAEAGAAGLVVARDASEPLPGGVLAIRVPDTLVAYGELARAWRRKLALPVVAITGSSGKTSTKETVAAYLGHWWPVAKTLANNNNEIGVPLTLFAIPPEARVAVVEMGMRGPGEIGYLAGLAEPDVGLVTNIGVAHIGRLGSQEAIARAKSELWREMPARALAIYPLDDAHARREALAWGGRALTFALENPAATVYASDVAHVGEGQRFTAHWQAVGERSAGSAELALPLWGDHHRANALAAVACGLALGLAPTGPMAIEPVHLAGRSAVHEVAGVTLVDDSYNANPDSMRAALKAFAESPTNGRRLAVLGDMGELGDEAPAAHAALARYAATLGLDGLVGVGQLAAHYAGPGWQTYAELPEAVADLTARLQPGDRVLFKASRMARFERLVAALEAALARPIS